MTAYDKWWKEWSDGDTEAFKAGMTAACDIARIYGKSFYDNGKLSSAAFILNVIALIEEERDGK